MNVPPPSLKENELYPLYCIDDPWFMQKAKMGGKKMIKYNEQQLSNVKYLLDCVPCCEPNYFWIFHSIEDFGAGLFNNGVIKLQLVKVRAQNKII